MGTQYPIAQPREYEPSPLVNADQTPRSAKEITKTPIHYLNPVYRAEREAGVGLVGFGVSHCINPAFLRSTANTAQSIQHS